MADIKYLPINKDAIPYRFNIKIHDTTYTFEVHYNSEGNYFTVDLYHGNRLLRCGEKIVYGRPLFNVYRNKDFPNARIVPWDFAGKETRVGWDTLNTAVFCWIMTEGETQ